MDNNDKETLSQLMDGEWQDLDQAQSVKNACADDALKATWSRYHLVRDVIRNESISVDTALSSRISAAIADEPTYSNVSAISTAHIGSVHSGSVHSGAAHRDASQETETTVAAPAKNASKTSYWKTGLGGAALAACVTLATVIGLNVWQGSPQSGNNVQTIANVPTNVPGIVLPEVEYVSNKGTYWVSPEVERSANAEKRLNMLLSAHIESSPTAERTGMLPYSRLVGYDSVAPTEQ